MISHRQWDASRSENSAGRRLRRASLGLETSKGAASYYLYPSLDTDQCLAIMKMQGDPFLSAVAPYDEVKPPLFGRLLSYLNNGCNECNNGCNEFDKWYRLFGDHPKKF